MTENIADAAEIGEITADGKISYNGEEIGLERLLEIYENKLESVYRCNKENPKTEMLTFSYTAENRVSPAVKTAKPKVLIPVFPGTNASMTAQRPCATQAQSLKYSL